MSVRCVHGYFDICGEPAVYAIRDDTYPWDRPVCSGCKRLIVASCEYHHLTYAIRRLTQSGPA